MSSFGKFVLALVCASFATTAAAAVQLDQSNIPETGPIPFSFAGTSLVPGYGLGQTVTAGLTGRLSRIDLMLLRSPFAAPQGGFTVSVEKTPGVSLASRHTEVAELPLYFAGDWSDLPQFDVSGADIRVTAGETFNIVLTVGAGPVSSAGYYYIANDTLPAYSGGGFFRHQQFGDLPYYGSLDQGFRTYVDVAVIPEPALWGVLILGFGLSGTALRRKAYRPMVVR